MKIITFDIDGTLAESKQPITHEMAALLTKLLEHIKVAIISGGALAQFLKQIVHQLPKSARFENLYLLPTSGASLYEYRDGEWHKVYDERISERDAHIIETVLHDAAVEAGVIDFSKPSWGERIEYRGGQVSLSALGQHAPVKLKKEWDPAKKKRQALLAAIEKRLPKGFGAAMGGMTTIDVTRAGVDKAYGVRQLCARLKIDESETLYVGDELGPGGNDEVVYQTNAKTKSVESVLDTEKLIEKIIPALTAQAG
jgi:HAD superfamily hydrolase (TIGR01484 family)